MNITGAKSEIVDSMPLRFDRAGFPEAHARVLIPGFASPGPLPACQIEALITALIASADRLAQLSRNAPAMTPSDAETICRQAIQALLATLKAGPDDKAEARSRKSSVRACVENYVKRNLSSKTLTPDSIYRQLEIPRSTLYKAFAETGGVAKYIQDQRLDVAKSLLLHPEEHRSLSQIADSLGFGTSARFSKAFRRRFGRSPRDMRQVHAGPSQDGGTAPAGSRDRRSADLRRPGT